MTDRRTDRRTGKNNMSPDPEGGRHNKKLPDLHTNLIDLNAQTAVKGAVIEYIVSE